MNKTKRNRYVVMFDSLYKAKRPFCRQNASTFYIVGSYGLFQADNQHIKVCGGKLVSANSHISSNFVRFLLILQVQDHKPFW